MNLYDLALAAHVAGVAAVFLALGAWLYGIVLLGRAGGVEQVRAAIELIDLSEPFVRAGGVLLAIAGPYMAVGTWGLATGWIIVGIGGALVVGILGGLVMEPRVKAIGVAVKGLDGGPVPPELAARLHEPLLAISVRVDVAVLFGIVVVMTAKPDWRYAVAVLVVAAVAGLAWAAAGIRYVARQPA